MHEGDLFTFFIGPAEVVYWHFIQAIACLFALRDELNFKSEPRGFDNQTTGNLGAHAFVTGFDVRTIQICENVIQESQKLVRQVMPIIEYPAAALHHESLTKRNIPATTNKGTNQNRLIPPTHFQSAAL